MTNRQKDKQTKKQAEKQKIGHCNEKIGFVLFVYNYAEIGEAKD
jgi:DNA-directed RNA polymerase subunit E'/Rpb7